nr:reverse transcriptase domain-containing protein [Tanacetum cinerariifolium]
MQEETKKRLSQSLQARLNFDLEYKASPLRYRKERRERDSRRPPVFTRIGKKVVGDQTADLQYLGNARNWFSKLPRKSIAGFKELRRAFRLNFTQRKKCAKNPVELARVKQRQREFTSAYVERYKEECIHVKACPEILKISGFMNGINNPELIKRLNDRRGGRGNDKYTPLTKTPKEILATEGANFPKPPPMRTLEERRVGNGSPSPYNGIIGRPRISAIRAVYYHDWLSHPVMVKRSDGSWRMCVDFTDLNKACPQDCYPLPKIDWKVESLCGYPCKCFLDAYKGYHQIQMAKEDEKKTAFHTNQGVYCYTKMPFGLKNVGATYQQLVDSAFEGQVSQNLEVYVDDLVIKIHTEDELVRDIEETFRTLRKVNMKLNPKKYTFGSTEGMFLGYLIEPDGIKPCPEKQRLSSNFLHHAR